MKALRQGLPATNFETNWQNQFEPHDASPEGGASIMAIPSTFPPYHCRLSSADGASAAYSLHKGVQGSG